MITQIEQEIQDYNQKIRSGDYPQPDRYCIHCQQAPVEFKVHDQRKRKLRVVVNALVQFVTLLLVRCKCPLCKATFTVYPDFIAPHKRYAVDQIVELSERYLHQKTGCEEALRDDGHKIGYPPENTFVEMKKSEETKDDESFMSGSTLWRWCNWLGSFGNAIGKALDIVRQTVTRATIFREFYPVYPSKYRSAERKHVLELALKVLKMRDIKIGEKKFFPHFAIRCAK
jgi:hypothetical protein